MASVYADPKLRSKRSYIAVSSFNNQLYTYTVTPGTLANGFRTTGAIGPTTSATTANCPQGRILREVGTRLYPDAHPGISTMMVKVYDANSGLNGYIDPNAPIFAVYNSDKPVEIVDGGDNNTTTPHKGQPVFTTGDVIAGGQVRSYGVNALTSITANGAATAQTVDPNLGQTVTLTCSPPSGAASITLSPTAAPAGATLRFIITATTVQNTVITFGGTSPAFREIGTLTVTAGAGPVTQYYVITFVCDGTNWYETGRTAAQV